MKLSFDDSFYSLIMRELTQKEGGNLKSKTAPF